MGISYMTMCTKHIYFFTVPSSMNYSINVSYYYWLIFKVGPESRFLCFPWVQRELWCPAGQLLPCGQFRRVPKHCLGSCGSCGAGRRVVQGGGESRLENVAYVVRIWLSPPIEVQDPTTPPASRHRSGIVLPMVGA